MRVLAIGGSGKVGSLVLPFMVEQHHVRVFDQKPPQSTSCEFISGDVTSPDDLLHAFSDTDALLYMAMGRQERGMDGVQIPPGESIGSQFDVNVKGVYLALWAAQKAGVRKVVYTSSMSVYQAMHWSKGESRFYVDEDLPPDARNVYGMTKWFGEEVCRTAAREWEMDVNVLRLCFPVSREKWLADAKPGVPTIATEAHDVARALLAALNFSAGFQVFTVSGDYEEKLTRLKKAKQLLGWEPLARPKSDTLRA